MSSKKRIVLSYIFVTGLGVLLHFTYEWSGENFLVGLFSAINESTWEHLKLVFFPMFLLTLWDVFHKYKNDENFLPARTAGILSAMFFIIVAYYTFVGATGQNVDFVNITIYFLGVAFGFWIERHVYGNTRLLNNTISVVVLFVFAALFVTLTYSAPNVGIFEIP